MRRERESREKKQKSSFLHPAFFTIDNDFLGISRYSPGRTRCDFHPILQLIMRTLRRCILVCTCGFRGSRNGNTSRARCRNRGRTSAACRNQPWCASSVAGPLIIAITAYSPRLRVTIIRAAVASCNYKRRPQWEMPRRRNI